MCLGARNKRSLEMDSVIGACGESYFHAQIFGADEQQLPGARG